MLQQAQASLEELDPLVAAAVAAADAAADAASVATTNATGTSHPQMSRTLPLGSEAGAPAATATAVAQPSLPQRVPPLSGRRRMFGKASVHDEEEFRRTVEKASAAQANPTETQRERTWHGDDAVDS